MQNRRLKRLALMLAVTFTMMPLPAMLDKTSQAAEASSTTIQSVPSASTAVNRAGVAINGVMKAAIDPIRVDGAYYVPFKEIAKILDYDDIRYNYGTKTYTATDGSVFVRVTIGATRAMKGDEPVNIQPPKFLNKTTYLSLDAVSSVFNTFTYFKPENGSIQIQLPARSYKVQAGDTLWEVAQAHHTTIDAVRHANGLKSNSLTVGQVLRLPPEAQTREMEPARESAQTPTPSPQSATPAQSSAVAAKQQAVIRTAKKYMGVPYKFGAKPEQAPRLMDCSSYTQYVFKQNGITLPRDSRQQSRVGVKVSKSQLQPGDLLFFKYPERYSDGRVGHVGIYMGNGMMIHTIPKPGVTTSKLSSSYWSKNYLYARRVIR